MMKYILLFTLLFATSVSFAQQTPEATYTIDQLVNVALKNDPLYSIAQMDSQIYQLQHAQSLSALLPKLDMSFDTRYNVKQQSFILPTSAFGGTDGGYKRLLQGTPWNANLAFDGSMPLFNASALANRKLTGMKRTKAMIDLESRKQQLTYDISTLYFELSTLQSLGLIYREQEQAKKEILEALSQKLAQGTATEIDVEQAKIDVELSQYNRELNFIQEVNTIAKIERFTGKLDNDLYTQSGELLFSSLITTTNDNDISNRSDIRLQQQTAAELLQISKVAKWNYLPTLNLNGRIATQAFRQTFDLMSANPWYAYSYVGVELKLSIFQGGFRMQATKIAQLEADKSKARLSDLEHQAQSEIIESQNNYRLAQFEMKLRAKELEAYRLREKSMIEKVALGAASSADLAKLNAEYTSIMKNLLNATEQALKSALNHKKALGNL
jgi:outer membrane protein TolC